MSRGLAWLLAALALTAALPSAAAAGDRGSDRERAERALQRVQDLKRGVGVRTGRELTEAIAELVRRRGALDAAGRRSADALLARPTDANDPQNDEYSVAEATPFCAEAHLCVHYVASTNDAPPLADTTGVIGVPDYVEFMASVFEDEVYRCENGSAVLDCPNAGTTGLGWPEPPGDGTRGGNSKWDVYIKDIGDSGIFGYVAPDPGQTGSERFSYLVMDDDYAQSEFPNYAQPDVPLRVTAAHEYNHVLQFGIETFQDNWMFESTATWAEEKVYPALNDYVNYMSTWVANTAAPLTDATAGGDLKQYGSAVWNLFIDGRWGRDTIRDAWVNPVEVNGGPFAPASYGAAIAANGGTGFSEEFDDFSAAVAEWRAPGSGFPDLYPDVPRGGNLAVDASGTTIQLDHTTFALRNVTPPASPSTLTLQATLPAGLKGAIALVGRTGGSTTGGTVTKQVQHVANGGAATVSLPNAETYGRITAVLVNSDPTQSGFNNGKLDWNFTRDNENFANVRVVAGVLPPPAVTTGPASDVGTEAAVLGGTVNPNGSATTWFFEYGTTTAYGSQAPATAASAGSGTGAVAQSQAITGLTRGTTYHYRLVATNAGGTTTGPDQTFTTLDPPEVVTLPATEIDADGAKLNATVDPNGRTTSYRFEYGTTTAYGSEIPIGGSTAGNGTNPVTIGVVVNGLAPGTAYHFRIVAQSADGVAIGGDATFTTATPAASGGTTSGTPTTTTTTTTPTTTTTTTTTTGTGTAPGSTVDSGAFNLTVVVARARLAAVLRRGLRTRAGCARACAIRGRLALPRAVARRLGLRSPVVAGGRAVTAGSASTALTLRFSRQGRRALARVRSVRLTLSLNATDSTAQRRTLTRRITLRR